MIWPNKAVFYAFVLFFPLISLANQVSDYFGSFKVCAYYPDYASWNFPVSSVPVDKLSHVIFFSIYPNADGSLNESQIKTAHLSSLVTLAHAQQTKVLICAGGWNLSQGFSPMSANPSARGAFIQNIKNFCLLYDLDGVDLDWEPVWTATDRANYTTLIQELKPVLQDANLTLSVAVFAQGQEFLASAISSIDWIGVMAYDLGYPHSTYEDALSAIGHWESFGFPRSKIVLGVPFYGRDQGTGYFAYREIVTNYQPTPDMDLVNGISFNGIDTIEKKTAHVAVNGYAGVMAWEITQDTADATSLLTAINRSLHEHYPPDFDTDGQVHLTDLYHLFEFWLRGDCSDANTWCGRADLDASGAVALEDLAVFSSYW